MKGGVVTEGLVVPPKNVLSPARWFDICVVCIILYTKYLHIYFLALIVIILMPLAAVYSHLHPYSVWWWNESERPTGFRNKDILQLWLFNCNKSLCFSCPKYLCQHCLYCSRKYTNIVVFSFGLMSAYLYVALKKSHSHLAVIHSG